jgi:hypothetical protein
MRINLFFQLEYYRIFKNLITDKKYNISTTLPLSLLPSRTPIPHIPLLPTLRLTRIEPSHRHLHNRLCTVVILFRTQNI